MAKKSKKNKHAHKAIKETKKDVSSVDEIMLDATQGQDWCHKITQSYTPYIITFLLSVLLYANTFNHSFALDDDIVICKNEFVLQGIEGLGGIFSEDLFYSFYKQMNTSAQLAGGRYRPLSVATFALEQEFIGTREVPMQAGVPVYDNATCWDENGNGQPDLNEDLNGDGVYNDKDCRQKGFGFRHINNTILYGIACCLVFLFLSTVVFKKEKIIAFISTLLFAAHPMHTEVVANVKSRDEIMCLLFMMLTLWLSHRLAESGKLKFALFGVLAFFAGILSKEYAVTLLILVPLSLYLFEAKFEPKKYITLFGCMLGCFVLYYMIRSGIGGDGAGSLQDKELMNNPYRLASETEKIGTKLFIFLKYLWTMIFPYKLSSDYGYNSIPYKDFGDVRVWLSILLLIGSVIGGFLALKKKSWVAFAIAFYMGNILLVTNLIFNVGATMGERLAFHSSLGFCMVLAWAIYQLAKKVAKPAVALYIAIPILLLYSIKTFSRNAAWESDITLAMTDVEIQPESVSLNGNASSRCIDLSEFKDNKPREKELLAKSIAYGNKAVSLHPGFTNGYLNLGLAHAKLEQYDQADSLWKIAFAQYPNHPNKQLYFNLLADAYYKQGFKYGGTKEWAKGAALLEKAIAINPNNARMWYDLGGFSYNAGLVQRATEAWKKALALDPNDPEIRSVNGLK